MYLLCEYVPLNIWVQNHIYLLVISSGAVGGAAEPFHQILLAAEYDLIWSRLTVLSSGNIIKLDTGSQIGSGWTRKSATWSSAGSTLGHVDISQGGGSNKVLWGPAWAWDAKSRTIGTKEKDWHVPFSPPLSFGNEVEEIRVSSDNDDRHAPLNATVSTASSKNVQLGMLRLKEKDWILITQIVTADSTRQVQEQRVFITIDSSASTTLKVGYLIHIKAAQHCYFH